MTDRGKGPPGKRPAKGKALPPPGDLFALGSKQTRSGPEPNLQKIAANPQPGEKKIGKRDSASLLGQGLTAKKPKLGLSQAQTFTPLGRPSDIERRPSPVPPTSLQFEESAIDVDGDALLEEILEAEENNSYDKLEGLLCGAVKHLRNNRSKPDPTIYLTLMFLAKHKPTVFNSAIVIEAFCSLLKRDLSLGFKSKGNSVVSVLACNVMMVAYNEEENWPDDFVKVYMDDALGERVWADRSDCKGFVDNISTAFNTNLPQKSQFSMIDMGKGDQTSPASPGLNSFEDEDKSVETDASSLVELQNIQVFPRYPYQLDNIESFVVEIIREQLVKRQPMDASIKNLLKLMTVTCGYNEIRQIATQKLEMWLQNPKLARVAQELLMSVCMNCNQNDVDLEVIAQLIKFRMKTKPLINHYLNCIRELLGQHAENMRMVLTHTIYNELSTARNPNNMSLIGAVFQSKPEAAAKLLAEIFQDLLVNKDDYLRALRALFREVCRSLRHEMHFPDFCLGMMQERTEPKFTEMEIAFKERYIAAVTDLITLSILQAITPALRETVSAIAKGDMKGVDIEILYSYQSQVSTIQRDAIWWLHTVIPKFVDLKPTEYVHFLHKVLLMESPEHYCKDNWPAEIDRSPMLRLASECPVLEDTLMRILVIGLSRELPLTPPDAIELADSLVKRTANLQSEGRPVIQVERLELVDALFNLCAYRHPENIALPAGYNPPTLAISSQYWKAWVILLIISAFNPTTFGLAAWKNYPTLKCLMEMVMTSNYKFPPPTTAVDDATAEEFRNKEKQVSLQEKQQILEFESYLAAATNKVTITESNSLLVAQLTTMDPRGIARRPPQQVLDQIKSLNDNLKIGQMLCRNRNPDFLLDIIQRQGTSQSMPWLAELVDSNEGSLDVLPVQCLCEFLLHETTDITNETQGDDDAVKFERHKKRQKLKKQEQLLTRLQTLVHDQDTDTNTTYEVLDYFFKRLSSHQANNRALAIKGLSMVVSRSQLSPMEEEEIGQMGSAEVEKVKHKWLLEHMPTLPMFPQVKSRTCAALRQACQIETSPSLVSAFIIFLSQHAMDHNMQELDELALDIAQLIVERTTVINYILPQDQVSRTVYSTDCLNAFIYLFVMYLRKAKEPNTEGYSWSNTQDQIILQWGRGESATMHILVVHAMIILLTYGSTNNHEDLYNELQETWFPENSKPPSAYLMDTSEEALLLPDWLKLRMIRSSSSRLVAAALQDLDPAQLLLFVQSFGIPVTSMSKLLQCLDNAVTMDPVSLDQAVVDKAYMAQLIEVQHLRGALGGNKFYFMLTDGSSLDQRTDESDMNVSSSEDSRWSIQDQSNVVMETAQPSQVVNTLLQTFNPSGRASPDADRHFQSLMTSVSGNEQAASNVVKGLLQILSHNNGGDFAKSLLQSGKACSLFKLLISKQAGVDLMPQVMEILSKYSAGQKSPLAAVIHRYLTSQSRREQRSHTESKGQILKISDTKQCIEDLSNISTGSSQVEKLLGQCMQESIRTGRLETGARLSCTALLESQKNPQKKMLVSTAALFIDWLELLDPEVIKLTPDLQEKLLFARQTMADDTITSAVKGEGESNHPYLLALLTHQTSWATLHRCILTLLDSSSINKYNPTSVLDFLSACIHIPTIWQGRERKISKNQSPEDVLGLNDSQIVCLVEFIIAEAANCGPVRSHDPEATSHVPVSIGSRAELLTLCICEEDSKVKLLTSHLENALTGKQDKRNLYQALLLELYLRYPYLISWLADSHHVTTDMKSLDRSHTPLDLIAHRLLTSLYQGGHSKKNDARMLDANIACRKLAAEHPILILRQLPVFVALLNGKMQFSFGEFRQRNFLTLFTYILGILELLQPQLFHKEHTALADILECYFSMLQTYAKDFRQLAPLIVKCVTFLHQFVTYDSQRASAILQKHVILLGNISSLYPDLSVLKSLLAGLTLPRKNQEEVTPVTQEETTPVVVPARPSSPWTMNHLAPFLQKIKSESSEDVLAVLKDLDETSKRKIDILNHFQDDLKRLMESFDEQCRTMAYDLVKRFIRQNPRQSSDFVATYLHCMENVNPEIVTTSLVNLAEFTLLCQDHADVILQKAFSIGVTSVTETSTYISESLQLMNLDITTQ